MKKEEIFKKMRELRDKRDLEILNRELENINIDVDYKKDISDNKVLDVKYLGQIEQLKEIDGVEEKELNNIYLLIEQYKNKEGELVQVEKYYDGDLEFLGGNNKEDGYELMLDPKHMDNKELLEQLKALDKEGILDLNEMEQGRKREIAKALGIDEKDLDKIVEMDEEQLKEAEEKLDEKDEEELEEKEDKNKEEDDEKQKFSKKEIEQVSTKNEIKANQMVTDRDTISSLLDVQNKGYTKIAIVYSDNLKDNKNTTRFTFVGIKPDGSAEKLDGMEQRYGITPSKIVHSLNRDGSSEKEENVSSIYSIKGKKETELSVTIGAMGTIEPKLVRTSLQDNQKKVSVPIETSNVKPTTREVREFINENRNVRIKEEVEKIEEHEENSCTRISIEDINDNPNDDTHTHMDEEALEKWSNYILENEDIERVFTKDEVKQTLERHLKENNGSAEEIANEVKGEMEVDAQHFKTRDKN